MRLIEIKNLYKKGLTEGVDFKRAEFLVVVQKQGRVTMMQLPINSYSVEFTRKWGYVSGGALLFDTDNYIYSARGNTINLVIQGNKKLDGTEIARVEGNPQVATWNIIATTEKITLNNYSISVLEKINNIIIGSNHTQVANVITTSYTSAITVDGVVKYIPCKLLRNIPSALDANNIQRNAGECGMYDCISGKFYGNIASSSNTFAVEGEVEEGNESKLLQIYAKESNNSNSGTETNTGDPEYGGEL